MAEQKIIAVVGATGAQGGGLVRAIPLAPLKVMYGPEMVSEMLLSGQRAQPGVLTSHGFTFDHPTLDAALATILREKI